MPTANDIALESDDRVLEIERYFDAPRAIVWEAFTKPEHLRHWMGPRDCPAISFEAEVRPGGKWRGCLRQASGDGDLWQGGIFHEVVTEQRLVYTFSWDNHGPGRRIETLVTITFTDEGDGTRMHFHQAFFNTRANRDGHGFGWNSAFDRLEDFLAKETA